MLQVASLVPSLAYKINDKVSIGAGVGVLHSFLDQDIAINQGVAPDGRVSLNRLDDWSVQGKLGLTWQVTHRGCERRVSSIPICSGSSPHRRSIAYE